MSEKVYIYSIMIVREAPFHYSIRCVVRAVLKWFTLGVDSLVLIDFCSYFCAGMICLRKLVVSTVHGGPFENRFNQFLGGAIRPSVMSCVAALFLYTLF